MTNDQLTAVLQQVTTQMASDYQEFATIGHDLNDHAMRLDKFGLATLANKVNHETSAVENVRAFKLIEASDVTVKDVATQVTAKTGEHAGLLKKVDPALRAQVQTKVSRLDALIAEIAVNAQDGSHTQPLAGFKKLETEVQTRSNDTRGHLGDLKAQVQGLHQASLDLRNHTQGVEVTLCHSVEQLAQAQHAHAVAAGAPTATATANAYAQAAHAG